LERHRQYLAEFEPPRGFAFDNGSYGPVDADVLHSIVRVSKPGRIVELGSGHTTLIIAAANRLNGAEGGSADYRAYDPYPGWRNRACPV
jgi:predicted O-methyltransferase YrrM